MTAGNPDPIAPTTDDVTPRRQIAFTVGTWRVTYAGPDPRAPRTGTLAGRPEFGPGGTRVPIVAVDGPADSVHWVDDRDIIAVTAGEPPVPGQR
ncbi:hypothetical protein [Amycolatopsis sp. cg9]|uniref:hypothetical protein n=1 Tax=Amycolatopsis sp. cg9 TaxID=3238801 RepID=UPI00352336EC